MNYMERDTYGMYKATQVNGAGPEVRHGPGPALMGADTLIGNNVYNRDSEDLGSIKEIMLDMRSGKVSYAVLSFGGFLGLGEKLFAVPWGALKLDTAHKRFMLDVDKDRLANAPGFDKDAWPDMADPAWARSIHAYYGSKQQASRSDASTDGQNG
jgi:sporulation protein YlmC with PRC-barrel domain